MNLDDKKKLITFFMEKNCLISPDLIKEIPENFNFDEFIDNVDFKQQKNQIVLTKDMFKNLINTKKQKVEIDKNFKNFVKILNNYDKKPEKREIQHFVKYFKNRYESMKKILQSRIELSDVISIRRLYNKEAKEKVSIIGLVSDKRITKNGHIMLEIEDSTGIIKVLINKNKKEQAEDIVLDEMLGIVGSMGNKIVFANKVFFPDIPSTKEFKKSPDDVSAVFISDIHVGSNMFLEKEFLNFISWLNGDFGNKQQREIAKKVKYLFIVGDLVDGVGIYPGQESELNIIDIYDQYNKCAEYLKKLRKDIQIIICAGNHDAVRMAEPQPMLDKNYAKSLYDLSNVIIVSNPSQINIHASENFPGFNIVLYHGYCFDYYISNVDKIRNGGGYDRADLVMELLLKKRHLSPTHASTLYIPDIEKDNLIIDRVPDFFVSGHIHKFSVSKYKSVTLLCGSCWQAKTSFQEKVGHNPEPCKVPVVNLKTRQVNVLRFDNCE